MDQCPLPSSDPQGWIQKCSEARIPFPKACRAHPSCHGEAGNNVGVLTILLEPGLLGSISQLRGMDLVQHNRQYIQELVQIQKGKEALGVLRGDVAWLGLRPLPARPVLMVQTSGQRNEIRLGLTRGQWDGASNCNGCSSPGLSTLGRED